MFRLGMDTRDKVEMAVNEAGLATVVGVVVGGVDTEVGILLLNYSC